MKLSTSSLGVLSSFLHICLKYFIISDYANVSKDISEEPIYEDIGESMN